MRARRPATWILFLLLLGAPLGAAGGSREAPFLLQAAIFRKIFDYDKELVKVVKSGLALCIASSKPGDKGPRDIQAAFEKIGIHASIGSCIEDAHAPHVIYVFPDAKLDKIGEYCKKKKVLSIAGTPSLVESGEAAVGVGVRENGRAEMIVNLRRLRNDGHQVSSYLLELARVVK
jgi:hypothetical protein